MEKLYKVLIIDDQPDDFRKIIEIVGKTLKEDFGYYIDFKLLSKQEEIKRLHEFPADIVMFDCNLSGSDIISENSDESRFGFQLLRQYREKNKKTQMIFYSGTFVFDDEMSFDLTIKEIIYMINELHIFRIANRSIKNLVNSLRDAIENIDTVMISLEELIIDYGDNGVFWVNDEEFTAEELLRQLKMGTEAGDRFRKEVNEMILTYFMKFGE